MFSNGNRSSIGPEKLNTVVIIHDNFSLAVDAGVDPKFSAAAAPQRNRRRDRRCAGLYFVGLPKNPTPVLGPSGLDTWPCGLSNFTTPRPITSPTLSRNSIEKNTGCWNAVHTRSLSLSRCHWRNFVCDGGNTSPPLLTAMVTTHEEQ